MYTGRGPSMISDEVEVALMLGWVGADVVVVVGVGNVVTGVEIKPISIVKIWQAEISAARIRNIRNLRFIGLL
jgi:hypothetical protein